MSGADETERQLKMDLMVADIANKKADTAYKDGLAKWEPWKVLATGFAAGAATLTAAVGVMALIVHLLGAK
jgi:hypothetical protein